MVRVGRIQRYFRCHLGKRIRQLHAKSIRSKVAKVCDVADEFRKGATRADRRAAKGSLERVINIYNRERMRVKSISKASVLRKNTNYIFCVPKLYNYPLAFGAGRPALTFGFLASKKSSIEIPSHS